MAQYLLELALIEYGCLKFDNKNIAASAIYLTLKINNQTPWTPLLEQTSGFPEAALRPCAKALCLLLQNAAKSALKAVRRKFAKEKWLCISTIVSMANSADQSGA